MVEVTNDIIENFTFDGYNWGTVPIFTSSINNENSDTSFTIPQTTQDGFTSKAEAKSALVVSVQNMLQGISSDSKLAQSTSYRTYYQELKKFEIDPVDQSKSDNEHFYVTQQKKDAWTYTIEEKSWTNIKSWNYVIPETQVNQGDIFKYTVSKYTQDINVTSVKVSLNAGSTQFSNTNANNTQTEETVQASITKSNKNDISNDGKTIFLSTIN